MARTNTCCKPLRLLELVSVVTCLSLLVLSGLYDPQPDTTLPYETLIYAYSAFGSLLIVTGIDVLCQLLREPFSNTPITIFLFLASTMCLSAGILLLLQYMFTADNKDTYIFLFILILLSSFSLFSSAVYTLDGILVLKCSTTPIDDD